MLNTSFDSIWRDISPFAVGFDRTFNTLALLASSRANETNYPPYITPVIADVEANYIPVTVGDCYENDDNWVYGCTYDTATNYNPDATFDDGSCDFMWGDVNHDGVLTIQDLILIVNEILNF